MDIIFTKAIYEQILLISETELQKKMWLTPNSKLISSYIEVMCTLYDDNYFEEFVLSGAEKMNFQKETILKLQKLNNLLNSYEELEFDEKIIEDKNWLVIVNHAKEIIAVWPDEYKSDFLKYLD